MVVYKAFLVKFFTITPIKIKTPLKTKIQLQIQKLNWYQIQSLKICKSQITNRNSKNSRSICISRNTRQPINIIFIWQRYSVSNWKKDRKLMNLLFMNGFLKLYLMSFINYHFMMKKIFQELKCFGRLNTLRD